MMTAEQAVRYLSEDPLLHMDMLEGIRLGEAQLLCVERRGVLLLHKACGAVMMSAADEETARRMLTESPKAGLFVAHQEFYLSRVQSLRPFSQTLLCRQAVYRGREPLAPVSCPAEIRRLDGRFLPFLMEHYTHADDEGYLRERLEQGAMLGAFVKGACAGFIGTHAEGSIGMLEVLPEFRRRGIAAALETSLANTLLREGRVPFAQIVTGNAASFALHKKLGFAFSGGTLCWLSA